MPPGNRPVAEVDVTPALVRRLLADQHPDLADRPIVELASGWDNVLYRLGDDLVIRLPRRALSAPLVAHEQRWLPGLAARLPVPVPAPVRVGRPASGYPWHWSVCPWIDGERAEDSVFDADAVARQLGTFLRALHTPAPADAPRNPYRGIPLADRRPMDEERLARLADVIDATVGPRLDELRATPPWPGPPVWVHGDLHPGNLLVDGRGGLAGVIDFGDLTAGDPAVDLSVAWRLLPAGSRGIFRAAVGGVDDDTWRRARGWAVALCLAHLSGTADDPAAGEACRRGMAAALDDVS